MNLGSQAIENSALSRSDVLENRLRLSARPQSIYMDVSNRCNLRCVMCPYHWNENDQRKAMVMDKQLFLRLGAELFPFARNVYLFGGGEVFMHPEWDELFDFARQFSFLPIISTHGGLLNDRRIQALVAAGTHLRISIDAATRQTFDKIRIGGDFRRTVNGIERLVSERERHPPGGRFLLRFSITSFDANIREAPAIVQLAARLGVDQVVFHHLMVDRNPLDGHQLEHVPELADEMHSQALERGVELGVHVRVPPPFDAERFGERQAAAAANRAPDRHREYFAYPLGPAESYTCRVPWVETWIKTDGRVMPCCMIAKELDLGQVVDRPFAEVWNGDAYGDFRRRVNSDRPPATCGVDACVYRIHQRARGLVQLGSGGRVRLDSRCPGALRARLEARQLRWQDGRLLGHLVAHNEGDTRWLASTPRDVGSVRLGLKTVDAEGNALSDHGRVLLERDVAPGESAEFSLAAQLPSAMAGFRLDLLAEGISWFESQGSPTLTLMQPLPG